MNFLLDKSVAPRLIKAFLEEVHRQAQIYPQTFRTDRGAVFDNRALAGYFPEQDDTHQQTDDYSHEYRGVAHRYIQRRFVMVRTARDYEPSSLFAEAYNCGCHINNGMPHSALKAITAYKGLHNGKASMSYL